MNRGSTALQHSYQQIPTNDSLNRESDISSFRYDLHAQKGWQYTIEIKNIGASILMIGGDAET